ncbi:MAG: hypothetical protein V4710_00705 [Verrucomicrobiota bacterium]
MSLLGIRGIGGYVPAGRADNAERLEEFEIGEAFLQEKLGVRRRTLEARDQGAE